MWRICGLWLGLFWLGVICPSAWGQVQITELPIYRQPIVLVTPNRPPRGASDLAFDVEVELDAKGHVAGEPVVSPQDAAFQRELKAVLKHWRFYPKVDAARCEAVASKARLRFEYEQKSGEPRVFLTYDPMRDYFDGRRPKVAQRAEKPAYPAGAIEGKFYLLLPVAADGSVIEARELAADTEGFLVAPLWRASKKSALTMRFEPSEQPLRCSAMSYSYKLE